MREVLLRIEPRASGMLGQCSATVSLALKLVEIVMLLGQLKFGLSLLYFIWYYFVAI